MTLALAMSLSLAACGTATSGQSEASSAATEASQASWVEGELARTQQGGPLEKAFDIGAKTTTDVPVYYNSPDDKGNITLAFFDQDASVPYVSLSTFKDLVEKAYQIKYGDTDYKLDVSADGNVATVARESGYWMKLDVDANTITFVDLDAFLQSTKMKTIFDQINDYGVTVPMAVELFEHKDTSYERYGEAQVLSLNDYGINIAKDGDEFYIPLATVNDFILSPIYVLTVYNGQSVILAEDGLLQREDTLMDVYYEAPTSELSPAMAKFSYNELCLDLDNHYGLKDAHGISNFDQLFINTGLKSKMLSTDPTEVDNAISEFICQHLDDAHSVPVRQSYHSGKDFELTVNIGDDALRMHEERNLFKDVRAKHYPDTVPAYEEVGDTAYITFDGFTSIPKDKDYYKNPPTKADAEDTVGLMLYSYAQITREGSPIKNVVMDLSCNEGGESSAAAFVIGTFLGEGTYSVRNAITGAMSTDYYNVDLNLDHKFDEKDSLLAYNLYCLDSPGSFSCGNLVPNVYKHSNKVTLLGQSSGGGSCIVLMSATAHGMIFNVSGPLRLAFTKNGSFYDIDRGADADIYISNKDNYYDRPALTNYIDGLF